MLGDLPAELTELTQLESLELWGNLLTGEIPPGIGNLTKLRLLHLGGNSLSGTIPPEISELAELEELSLYDNQLSGGIPDELGRLTQLVRLELCCNQFSVLPPELGNLVTCKLSRLAETRSMGEFPLSSELRVLAVIEPEQQRTDRRDTPELGKLSDLWELFLGNNRLTGTMPPELGNLAKLHQASLASNNLSGDLPSWLGNLKRLRSLDLSNNDFSGSSARVDWRPVGPGTPEYSGQPGAEWLHPQGLEFVRVRADHHLEPCE